jgi:hypothetical protein
METALKEAQIPEIWETEEDKKLSTFDLKTKYKIYLQNHFQGKQYFNKDMGVWISVSSDCVRQWVKKSRTREKIILIQVLDFLLENSQYEGPPIPDRKNRAEIEHYKHFHQSAFIHGNKYNVILKVVKPVNKRHKIYYYSLEGASNLRFGA